MIKGVGDVRNCLHTALLERNRREHSDLVELRGNVVDERGLCAVLLVDEDFKCASRVKFTSDTSLECHRSIEHA